MKRPTNLTLPGFKTCMSEQEKQQWAFDAMRYICQLEGARDRIPNSKSRTITSSEEITANIGFNIPPGY